MSYQLKVIKDYPIGFWPLDESSGTTAADISGCGNNGTYVGGLQSGGMPLVSGGVSSTTITNTKYITFAVDKDYYGSTADGGLADYNSSDNDFTLECWIYPRISTSGFTTIFADATSGTGIYWDKGNVVFKAEAERIDYTISYLNKAFHIVATYTPTQINLYVDGKWVGNKDLINFKFTASDLTLAIGPTTSSNDTFLIDAPAVYRYALPEGKIQEHYLYSGTVPAYQVAYPENGTLFDIFDNNISTAYTHAYPRDRSWEYFLTNDLIYDSSDMSLNIAKTASAGPVSVVLQDVIGIPASFAIDSSKIEWSGNNGISVEASIDGTTYIQCVNGRSLPQFKLVDGLFSTEKNIYLRITLSSSDTTKYLPKLNYLFMSFYKNQRFYSATNADYIYTLEGLNGATDKEITMGRVNSPILSRDSRNGLVTGTASGFRINTLEPVRTIEAFVKFSAMTANCLISTDAVGSYAASRYSWTNSGTVTKNNILKIYVNGVDRTTQTNISNVFEANELYHVIIVLSAESSGPIKFNYLTSGGPSTLYQYISYYPAAFDATNALFHYNMHIGKTSYLADDSSMSVTENGVEFYNIDWSLIQSV